jgi:hypothetical protein
MKYKSPISIAAQITNRRFARVLLLLNVSILFRYWAKTHISEVKNKM